MTILVRRLVRGSGFPAQSERATRLERGLAREQDAYPGSVRAQVRQAL